jgi:hypothetical protein
MEGLLKYLANIHFMVVSDEVREKALSERTV